MNRKNNNQEMENAEYGVDSRYTSKKRKEADGTALMEARLERMKSLSKDQLIKAKLLQLKLQMEAFLNASTKEKKHSFTFFLKTYIDTIYDKRKYFAQDISITPVLLSQILNKHREPKEEFLLRLMVHTEKTYENICAFSKKSWFQVYFHEKIANTLSNQEEWRPQVEEQVTISSLNKAS